MIFNKALLVVLMTFSSLGLAHGRWAVQGQFGMEKGASQYGLDIDYMNKNRSVGAFILMAHSRENVRSDFWSSGIDYKFAIGRKGWRLYFAPGFGMTNFSLANGGSKSTLGPLFKIGVFQQLSNKFALGFEHLNYYNWSSDGEQLPSGFAMGNLIFRWHF